MDQITRQEVISLLPPRPANAHKGMFGRVLVVAGSREMCGAGLLCAKSALRAGAGLVYWALPASMHSAFAAAVPEVITVPLPENERGEIAQEAWPVLTDFIEKRRPTLAVVGMGMQDSPLLPQLLQELPLPLVVDADALNALAKLPSFRFKQPSIITPHAAEIARLLNTAVVVDESFRILQAAQLADQTGAVCVLKGPGTIVAVSDEGKLNSWQNPTGGPALAKGGSGDVLCGVIAGLWAQYTVQGLTLENALHAATCAVYVHGLAGDLAAEKLSDYGVLSSDISNYIPVALRELLQEKK